MDQKNNNVLMCLRDVWSCFDEIEPTFALLFSNGWSLDLLSGQQPANLAQERNSQLARLGGIFFIEYLHECQTINSHY